jgi:excisionase family DNA binding protein
VTTPSDPPALRRAEFPPVLTTALAAELLQVHAESLRRMVREGRVPCHRLGGGRDMRFLRDELLAWLADQPGDSVRSAPARAPSAPR